MARGRKEKLNQEQKAAIRDQHKGGMTILALCQLFNVSYPTIKKALVAESAGESIA